MSKRLWVLEMIRPLLGPATYFDQKLKKRTNKAQKTVLSLKDRTMKKGPLFQYLFICVEKVTTLKTFAADKQPGDLIRPQGSFALK